MGWLFGFYNILQKSMQVWKSIRKINFLFGFTPVMESGFAPECGKVIQNGS